MGLTWLTWGWLAHLTPLLTWLTWLTWSWLSPDYALLERLFERASPANAPLEHPVRARDPAYALLERLFERALARASACASLHIEVLPAAGAA